MSKMTPKDEQEFKEWWSKHGQFCRAGGGEYEKTFAYHAWERQADRYNFVADRRAAIEQRLFVWAHEKLDEERKTEYFNIIANGMESVHDDNNYMRLLNQEKHRALIAEREVERLKQENATFQDAVIAGIGHLANSQQQFHQVMGLLRDMQKEHGTCQPRERRACTHCNAKDDLDKLLAEYKGQPIVQV